MIAENPFIIRHCDVTHGADVMLQIMQVMFRYDLTFHAKLQAGLELLLPEVSAERGSLMLLTEDGRSLEVVAASKKKIIGMVQEISPDSVSGYVISSGEPLLVADINNDPRFPSRNTSYKTCSLVSVPLISCHSSLVLGVLNISDKKDNVAFTQKELDLLNSYAGWVSPLLENIRLLDQVSRDKERYRLLAQELEIKQKELLASTLERVELVQMVVHDFKSPLSAIISNLDLLQYLGVREDQVKILETGLAGANSLIAMIDEFLEMAQMDHWKKEDVVLVPLPLRDLVGEEMRVMESLASAKAISLDVEAAQDVQILGDRIMVKHLVQNLLSNAIKYTPREGMVRVGWDVFSSKRAGDCTRTLVKVWVEDSGIGVGKKYREAIFEKFSRTARARSSGVQGNGIGLFLCRKIIGFLGGKLWVEDAPSQGSRFCFTLFVPGEDDYGTCGDSCFGGGRYCAGQTDGNQST